MSNLLKEYIPELPEDLSKFEYLKIIQNNNGYIGGGLKDQIFQLKVYLCIAYHLGLKLLLPKNHFPVHHNAGKAAIPDWHEYWDLENSTIHGKPIEYIDTLSESQKSFTVTMNTLTPNYNRSALDKLSHYFFTLNHDLSIGSSRPIDMKINKTLFEAGKKASIDHNIDSVIWIRRGDRAADKGLFARGIDPRQYDILTQADNILRCLRNAHAPEDLYIMTDMVEGDPVIDDLNNSSIYNFKFYYDLPEFKEIKSDNNYKLFQVERAMFILANYKLDSGYWFKDLPR